MLTKTPGVFRIKNISSTVYHIEELQGYELESQSEIDLLDQNLPTHYLNWQHVQQLLRCPSAKLVKDIANRKIQILENTAPQG